MEWPHGPDGEAGSEGKRLYGHAILAKKLDEDEDFPLSIETFAEEVGHHPIRIDHERVVPAAEILDAVEEDEVEDIVSFHRAVGRAMRATGNWSYELTPSSSG